MARARSLDRKAVALMLVLCASWGVQQVMVKLALDEVGPISQALLRSMGGTLIVSAWALWREPAIFRRDGTLWPGILAGLLFAAEFVVLFLGLKITSASHAILYLYTAPFFVAIGAALLLPQERLFPAQWLGLGLSFLGVAVGLGASTRDAGSSLAGDILTLAAGAFWGWTTVLVKATRLREASATKVLLYQLAVSVVVLAAAWLWTGEALPTRMSWITIVSLLYQVVWVAGCTFLGWFWLIRNYHSGEVSSFSFLTPLIGVVAAFGILGEPLRPGFMLAVAMVAAGIVLVNRPRRVSPLQPPPGKLSSP